MGLQMIDGDVRQAAGERDPFGELAADDQPADQTGSGTGGDGGQAADVHAGPRQHVAHQGRQMGEVGTRRDFRHHAAEGCVVGLLRQHDLRQDAAVLVQHRGGGFVAGRLDPEDRACRGTLGRRQICRGVGAVNR